MTDRERAVEILRWRLVRAVGLRDGLSAAGAWCLAWGLIVLISRYVWLVHSETMAWGFLGILVAGTGAGVMAWRKLPSDRSLTAMLDRHNGLGGLLMASESVELGPWSASIPTLDVPLVDVRLRSSVWLLSAGLAFLCIGLVLPDRVIRFDAPKPMDVTRPAEQLTRQIEALEQHKILDPKLAKTYKEQLEQIKEGSDGTDPARTWEALDHLQTQVQREAAETADKAVQQSQALSQAQALDQAMMNPDEKVDSKTLSDASKELSELVQKATQENAVTLEIPEALQKALQDGTLTPEEMKKLAEMLKSAGGDLKQMMQDLKDAKLIDAQTLEEMADQAAKDGDPGQPGDGDPMDGKPGDGTPGSGFNKHMYSAIDLRQIMARGSGGPGGGGGPSDLSWKSMSEENGAKFKEVALPPDDAKSLQGSHLTGLSASAPKLDTASAGSSHDALANTVASGGEAHTHAILPHHQGPVERFFERTKEEKGKGGQ